MKVGVSKETTHGERRVALVPELVPKLGRLGFEVYAEKGCGIQAGFPDQQYSEKGARIVDRVIGDCDVVLKVRAPSTRESCEFQANSTLIGLLDPFMNAESIRILAQRRVSAFAMELMPRIARAQAMDALSAMSAVAGYKAVLLAANHLSKFFPLLMTAAGTMPPARVFVIGAGVAGLEAIGTAKRLGAVVEAYDTRPAVKEEVQSVGATFIELGMDTADAEEKGGYARAQSADFYKKQQELMAEHVRNADVVITAALVRGLHAPILLTEEMVRTMRPGSVIVDLAADQGGNCALTQSGKELTYSDVLILGPANLASTMPFHASEMYARTVYNFLTHLVHDGAIQVNLNDELTQATLVAHLGQIVNEVVAKRSIA